MKNENLDMSPLSNVFMQKIKFECFIIIMSGTENFLFNYVCLFFQTIEP